MDASRFITAWILIILGIVLFVVSMFFWVVLIYAIPIFIVGILILINFGREEKIEPIKSSRISVRKIGKEKKLKRVKSKK